MSKVSILKINIDKVNLSEAKQKVRDFLTQPGQFKIFTPNPEMAVKAQKDEYFRTVLNAGDLNICDGMGLSWATKVDRLPGVDFMLEICGIAEENGKSVYLTGSGSESVVKKTKENLKKKFPNLNIVGIDPGPSIVESHNKLLQSASYQAEIDNYNTMAQVNGDEPDILFVAFGMGKQEKWIYENLPKMPSVKIAMGVGGSFDFISGNIRRAPCWMRKNGLEWLYRLIQQPSRFWRIFNATFKFLVLVIYEKFFLSNPR